MTICYFGIYDPEYSRSRILIRGLEENGAKIIRCHSKQTGLRKYVDLLKKYWVLRNQYDIMLVGYPGQRVIFLAWILSRKPLIFDAFISVYDSRIFDRTYAKPRSLRSIYYWLQDYFSCRLADKVLLDTKTHIDYFVKTFRIEREKFQRVLVGSDDRMIFPKKKQIRDTVFTIHFHGTFIPLQGIEYIIQAAKMLEQKNIRFNIIGQGQTYASIRYMAEQLQVTNVTFTDNVPYRDLGTLMSHANVCLGIFGNTQKAKRVIPNKVYEALASKCPCITGDSPAIRELLTDNQEIFLVNMADPKALAEKILELTEAPELLEKISEAGYLFFQKNLTPKKVTKDLFDLTYALTSKHSFFR